MGAQPKIRPLWRHYTNDTDVLIWVVDSTDRERFQESREELHKFLSYEDSLKDTVLLVAASKQDLPNAASLLEISEALELHKFPATRQWFVCGGSGLVKNCFEDGMYYYFELDASVEILVKIGWSNFIFLFRLGLGQNRNARND